MMREGAARRWLEVCSRAVAPAERLRSGPGPADSAPKEVVVDTQQKSATATIVAHHEKLLKSLPMQDEQDFADARRGFLGALDPGVVRAGEGRVVWDNDSYAFLTGTAPPTVNPSLWRQSTLNAIHGLFEVEPGIYQVRGLDLSNVSFIEGDSGSSSSIPSSPRRPRPRRSSSTAGIAATGR
jgi:hypothetical protein